MEYRTHTCGELTLKDAGATVRLAGWVHRRRDLGGLIFIDLRDRYGITQVVFNPDVLTDFSAAEALRYEYVVSVQGLVKKRAAETINKETPTGTIELHAAELTVISRAKPLPFEIFDARKGEEDEELRMQYRYLELRREHLKENIIFRAKMVRAIRDYMEARNFVDIATPILTVSSPEGARDFLVPSRLHSGKFYALPQAPQQYKQLLMVGGLDRYYQIAPCMRDEDARADRAPGEFYQLDVETSFLTRDEFFEEMEPLFVELTEKLAGKKAAQKPFPRIPFRECMETYGSDRPDLRVPLTLTDVSAWAQGTGFQVFKKAEFVRALFIPGGHEFSRKDIETVYEDAAKRAHARGLAWMKYESGKWDGGVSKFFEAQELEELKKLIIDNKGNPARSDTRSARSVSASPTRGGTDSGFDSGIIFFVADNWEVSCKGLGAVRELAGERMKLADENTVAWAWIVDFPMYEKNEETGKIDFGHNPFSMPVGGLDALNTKDPLEIVAYQYDIIANGLELSSGAVRNMDTGIMYKAFEIAGYTKKDVDKKFGHMISAFEYGAPPHCGFAPGIERLAMLLLGEKNIRAVIPFPKNQKAEEPMMGSPSEVSSEQLKELHIRVQK